MSVIPIKYVYTNNKNVSLLDQIVYYITNPEDETITRLYVPERI
jgi:hypothetical protein